MNFSEIDNVLYQVAPLLAEWEPPLARTIGWEIIYSVLTPEIHKALRIRRLPESDRDDCCQEIWLALSQTLPRMNREPGSFSAWLHGLIRNKMVDRLRRARHRNIEPLPECESMLRTRSRKETRAQIENVEQIEEVQRLLRHAASQFSPERLNVFRLRYLEERSVDETAKQLNLTTIQVRQITHCVLKSLRNAAGQNF